MYLQVLEQQERFHLGFWKVNHREKDMNYAFSSYKLVVQVVPGVFIG